MVSGFLISPYDHDRIFSGDAIEIRIWSKTWAGVVGLKRFIISWFMVFSSHAGESRQQIPKLFHKRAGLDDSKQRRECPAHLSEGALRSFGRACISRVTRLPPKSADLPWSCAGRR